MQCGKGKWQPQKTDGSLDFILEDSEEPWKDSEPGAARQLGSEVFLKLYPSCHVEGGLKTRD